MSVGYSAHCPFLPRMYTKTVLAFHPSCSREHVLYPYPAVYHDLSLCARVSVVSQIRSIVVSRTVFFLQ